MDENRNPMALDTDDRVTRLESGLFDAREQARAQQNTLDNILQLLQHLPALGDPHIPGDPTTASRVPIPTTPMSDSTPHVRAQNQHLQMNLMEIASKAKPFLIHADSISPCVSISSQMNRPRSTGPSPL